MFEVLISFLLSVRVYFRTRSDNQLEILALRHQIVVLQRKTPKPQTETDGSTFMGMAVSMLASMAFCAFDRETDNRVVDWHRRGFRWYWTWKVRHGHVGRPSVAKERRELIRTLSRNNSIWERREFVVNFLGIQISEASVAKYMVRHRKPPSQTWRTFLKNHAAQLASVDFFTVPTALFQVFFVFIVMRHDRRRIVHFNVTAHPTAEWTAHQILEAFPFDLAPKYLLRDRDRIYGHTFREQVAVMQIKGVLGAWRCPWQRAFVERVIGSIRRECLDHVIVLDEKGLRRVLASYFSYYHRSRLHLSLDKDSPDPRPVQSVGRIVAIPP